MANGSFHTNVGSHWRLLVEWSSTPDIANNRSSVTVNFYWQGLNQYSAVYASSSNSGGVSINGSNQSFTATSGLNANQKKLLHSRTINVNHNSDGSKQTAISCNFDINATLAGTYVGNRSLSQTVTLDNIPRKSTLTSSRNWTAGENRSISISRASSGFTHTIQIYVPSGASSPIKTITGIGTSTTASFTTAENKAIFQAINGGDNTTSRIRLTTFSGSTNLGYNDYTGTITAPNSSYVNSSRNFNIGDSLYISVSRANSSFTHTIRIKAGSTTVATLTGVGYSTTWNPTTTQNNALYNATPNSNSLTVTFDVETFYDGVKVKTNRTNTGTATVTNSNPTFSSSNFTYLDSNSATVAITGDNKQLIEGHSTLSATLSTLATARNGASMTKYVITVGGLTAERTTTGTTAMGKINSGANQTLTIEAIDSRGNSTKATQTVIMIPYSKPSLNAEAYRVNNFGTDSRLEANGSFSRLMMGTTQKNSIVSLQYRQRTAGGTWGSWTDISHTTSSGNFSGSVPRTLVITTSYEFEVKITDRLSSNEATATVTTGQPILFMEADRWAVGIGKLPDAGYQLDVQGNTRILGDLELVSSSEGGYLTFERTATHIVKYDVDLGWGGWGIRNLTDGHTAFHVDRNGNMNIGERGSSHSSKLYVNGQITATSGINLPNASGTGNGYLLPNQNSLTVADNIATIYVNRAQGEAFRVRSHSNSASYRNDLLIDTSGNLRLAGHLSAPDWFDISPDTFLRLGRYTNVGANTFTVDIMKGNNSTTVNHRLRGNGNTHLAMDSGNVIIGSGLAYSEKLAVDGVIRATGGVNSGSMTNPNSNILYIGANQETRVVNAGDYNSYQTIRAGSFPTGSSILYKENVTEFERNALEIVMAETVHQYHLKSNLENGIFDKQKVGFISEMVNPLLRDEDGVDTYSIVSVLWKATQEQQISIERNRMEIEGQYEINTIFINELDAIRAEMAQMKERIEFLETA